MGEMDTIDGVERKHAHVRLKHGKVYEKKWLSSRRTRRVEGIRLGVLWNDRRNLLDVLDVHVERRS